METVQQLQEKLNKLQKDINRWKRSKTATEQMNDADYGQFEEYRKAFLEQMQHIGTVIEAARSLIGSQQQIDQQVTTAEENLKKQVTEIDKEEVDPAENGSNVELNDNYDRQKKGLEALREMAKNIDQGSGALTKSWENLCKEKKTVQVKILKHAKRVAKAKEIETAKEIEATARETGTTKEEMARSARRVAKDRLREKRQHQAERHQGQIPYTDNLGREAHNIYNQICNQHPNESAIAIMKEQYPEKIRYCREFTRRRKAGEVQKKEQRPIPEGYTLEKGKDANNLYTTIRKEYPGKNSLEIMKKEHPDQVPYYQEYKRRAKEKINPKKKGAELPDQASEAAAVLPVPEIPPEEAKKNREDRMAKMRGTKRTYSELQATGEDAVTPKGFDGALPSLGTSQEVPERAAAPLQTRSAPRQLPQGTQTDQEKLSSLQKDMAVQNAAWEGIRKTLDTLDQSNPQVQELRKACYKAQNCIKGYKEILYLVKSFENIKDSSTQKAQRANHPDSKKEFEDHIKRAEDMRGVAIERLEQELDLTKTAMSSANNKLAAYHRENRKQRLKEKRTLAKSAASNADALSFQKNMTTPENVNRQALGTPETDGQAPAKQGRKRQMRP